MRQIKLKLGQFLQTIFGGLCLIMAFFVFQACGLGADADDYVTLTGEVRSKTTNLPIEGIKIAVSRNGYYKLYGFTDQNGKFDYYTGNPRMAYEFEDKVVIKADSVKVEFIDIDGAENGSFSDTTIFINTTGMAEVKMFVKMKEKQ